MTELGGVTRALQAIARDVVARRLRLSEAARRVVETDRRGAGVSGLENPVAIPMRRASGVLPAFGARSL